jgi:hypothetical protein
MDARLDFRLAPVPIFGLDEVPLRSLVVDETTWLPADVAVRDLSGEAALRQGFLDLFAEHDGTVFAASAAEGNRQQQGEK